MENKNKIKLQKLKEEIAMSDFKLQAKLFIEGSIELKTGMHIGGSTTALDIGGIDSNVIKTANGVPYIPGSSLKGKMRSLIEKSRGLKQICDDTEGVNQDISKIFGLSGNKSKEGFTTRFYARDAYLDEADFNQKKEELFSDLELDYTEGKWENTIDRLTSAANPRQLERVPAGAKFKFSMVYNIYEESDIDDLKTVIEGMRLLQDDYLGGSGSRGYGQIEFKDINISLKTLKEYEEDNKPILLFENQTVDININELKEEIRAKLKNGAKK